MKYTIELPWVHYSATKGPGGQIPNYREKPEDNHSPQRPRTRPLLELDGTLLEHNVTLLELNGTLLELNVTLLELHGTLLDFFVTLLVINRNTMGHC